MLVLKLDEIPDEGLDLKWEEDQSSLSAYLENLSQIDFEFEAPLQSEVKVRKGGHSVLINGRIQTVLRLKCARCLKEFSHPLSLKFELNLSPSKETSLVEEVELSEGDMGASFFSSGEIHLSEIACEQIFLEIPIQPLCHEACKGLCPNCGKDLNFSSCDCMKEEFESGFSTLRKLKLN